MYNDGRDPSKLGYVDVLFIGITSIPLAIKHSEIHIQILRLTTVVIHADRPIGLHLICMLIIHHLYVKAVILLLWWSKFRFIKDFIIPSKRQMDNLLLVKKEQRHDC